MSIFKKNRVVAGVLLALIVATMSVTFLALKQPTNQREWLEEFSVLNHIEYLNSSAIRIRNVRDWRYQDQTITEKNYQDRIVQPGSIERAWFVIEPFSDWSAVAHTFFIFDFADQAPLAFSIEARRESHEKFSAWKGMLNEYELYYSWGTEADFLRRRAEYLKHEVYMYPLTVSSETAQALFVELVQQTHHINQNPEFYNTLTSNCTSNLAKHANQVKPIFRWHPALFLTGLSEKYLYQKALLPQDSNFEVARQRHRIDELVRQHSDEELSIKLREYLLFE